jgi:hypothetical protein
MLNVHVPVVSCARASAKADETVTERAKTTRMMVEIQEA